jgi:hypothetical protein
MQRKMTVGVLTALLFALVNSSADAALSASATITRQQLGANSFEYSLTLTDTGTTPIGTFWVAWLPGYDLLHTAPTSIVSPPGWTGQNAPDAFGVASSQWVNSTTPLQPGQSLSGFTFDTPDSNVTTGTSNFFGLPIDQSYVYIGAPETDPGFALTPTVVPEPASLAIFAVPALLMLRRHRRA